VQTLRSESGLALLSALLSVALLTLIVVEMTDATFVHRHLTRNAGNVLAARLLARSGQIGAEEALRAARTNEQIDDFVSSFIDAAPLTLPTAGGHVMQIAIRDETGRLNLNDALRYDEAFRRLFADLGIDPGLLDAVEARTDTSEAGRLRDPSSDCSLAIPCDPPRGELRSLDDVRTIRGFTDTVIARLRPFVTAHRSTKGRGVVNLRTARPEVLRAIGCGDTESLPPPPRSSEDITTWLEGAPCAAAKPAPRDLRSDVYSIVTVATVGEATQTVESTVEVGKGPLTWKQQSVWGVGPGGVP